MRPIIMQTKLGVIFLTIPGVNRFDHVKVYIEPDHGKGIFVPKRRTNTKTNSIDVRFPQNTFINRHMCVPVQIESRYAIHFESVEEIC